MNLAHVARLCRTIRHLRPAQLLWRARYNMERRWSGGQPSRWQWRGAELPRVCAALPDIPLFHAPYADSPETQALLAQGTFGHLNLSRDTGRERPDWQLGLVRENRLWVAMLHCHPWAFALAQVAARGDAPAAEAKALLKQYLSDWIARCALATPGARHLAWNSYVVATRVQWWVRTQRLMGAEVVDGEFGAAFLRSLWEQAAFLDAHIEWDLRANHLLRDAAGLAWAGRFFDEPPAKAWLQKATGIAAAQAEEQVLPDGGHFERSPMYHVQAMEDMLSLALLLEDAKVRARLRELWQRMAEFLSWMRHPNGGLVLFNDGALNGSCAPGAMLTLGAQTGLAVTHVARKGGKHFADTGVAIWHGTPWDLFFDVGPVGPDCQPGHAHADTLTIEASFAGQRLFIDAGTHSYDNDERRRYDRSTAAHNTVCVDGADSSEVWHIFRVGRRAYPCDVRVDATASGLTASASHTGYDHLRGHPRHTRSVQAGNSGALTITDTIQGGGSHAVTAGLLLAPEWSATATSGGWELTSGDKKVRVSVRGPECLQLSEETRPCHQEYGLEQQTRRLCWRCDAPLPSEVVTVAEGV